MPYSFVDIEKQKSWIIRAVFFFLFIFYLLVAEIIWLITKLFFAFELETQFETVRVPFGFSLAEALVVFFVALIAAFIHWRFSIKDMMGRILKILGAQEPDSKDTYHQVLKNVVEEVSVATGGKRIDCRILPTSSLNAFAISDFGGNAAIGVTEGLLARLNRSQLEAVIGHEAAHITSGDSLLTTVTCSLFGVYSALLEGVSKALSKVSRGRRAGGVVAYLVIIYLILSITQIINFLLNMFLSRQKEYRADAVAVRLTRNPISLAEALYIISRGWRGVGAISSSLSPIFITNPDYSDLEESEGLVPDLLSTHPPTKNRLAILLDMAHQDLSTLKSGIKSKGKLSIEEGIVEIKEEPKREWLVYKDDSWQGPLGLEELLNFGLTPNSWVSKLNEGVIKHASEDETLNRTLRSKLIGEVIKEGEICPECNEPLGEILYEGAPILKCYFCEGVFVGRDVIPRIIAREDFSFPQSVMHFAEVALKTYTENIKRDNLKVAYEVICPKCKVKMWRGIYSYGYPIEVDRCERCQSVWFNKFELEALQCLIEKLREEGV